MITAGQLIRQFGMIPHPEGGFYARTYTSAEIIPQAVLPARFGGDRFFSTAIYYLLQAGDFSAFHRISSDEGWHFYTGQALWLYVIHPGGELNMIRMGDQVEKGERFQYIVPAGCWFAAEPAPGSAFSFLGCTVAPGFDFADFEQGQRSRLMDTYPEQAGLVRRLTRTG